MTQSKSVAFGWLAGEAALPLTLLVNKELPREPSLTLLMQHHCAPALLLQEGLLVLLVTAEQHQAPRVRCRQHA